MIAIRGKGRTTMHGVDWDNEPDTETRQHVPIYPCEDDYDYTETQNV